MSIVVEQHQREIPFLSFLLFIFVSWYRMTLIKKVSLTTNMRQLSAITQFSLNRFLFSHIYFSIS